MALINDHVKTADWWGAGIFGIGSLVFGAWLLLGRCAHRSGRLGNLVLFSHLNCLAMFGFYLVEIHGGATSIRSGDSREVESGRWFVYIFVSMMRALLVSALLLNSKRYNQWTLALVVLAGLSQFLRYLGSLSADEDLRWIFFGFSLFIGLLYAFCAVLFSKRSHGLRITFSLIQALCGLAYAIMFVLGHSQTRVFTALLPESIAYLISDVIMNIVFSSIVVTNYKRPDGAILPGTRASLRAVSNRLRGVLNQAKRVMREDRETAAAEEDIDEGGDVSDDEDYSDDENDESRQKQKTRNRDSQRDLTVSYYRLTEDGQSSPQTLSQAAYTPSKQR